jgi:hypothetical protein
VSFRIPHTELALSVVLVARSVEDVSTGRPSAFVESVYIRHMDDDATGRGAAICRRYEPL